MTLIFNEDKIDELIGIFYQSVRTINKILLLRFQALRLYSVYLQKNI